MDTALEMCQPVVRDLGVTKVQHLKIRKVLEQAQIPVGNTTAGKLQSDDVPADAVQVGADLAAQSLNGLHGTLLVGVAIRRTGEPSRQRASQ